MVRPQKVRPKPRISAPKLGDYLDARSAAARERILRMQKFPPDYVVARYRDAEMAMRGALLSSDDTAEHLARSVDRLQKMQAKPGWQADARNLCARAVHVFSKIAPKLEKNGVRFAPAPADGYLLRIEGVMVSVSPLVRVIKKDATGTERHGLILAVIRKDARVSERVGSVISQLLRSALEGSGVIVDPKLCVVVDVFGSKIFGPARASRRMSDEIVSACREIADRWGGLTQRGAA